MNYIMNRSGMWVFIDGADRFQDAQANLVALFCRLHKILHAHRSFLLQLRLQALLLIRLLLIREDADAAYTLDVDHLLAILYCLRRPKHV